MTLQEEKQLISAAEQGIKNALTSDGKKDDIRFGAAVLVKSGKIYAAGQYYSDTASLTLHAEQAALAHAASHGEYDVVSIAVVGNEATGNSITYPCHMCKQLLWESHLRSGCEIEILIIQNSEVAERLSLTQIMSHTWPQ